ncbi:hypothetical protein TRFO_37984 [Tritrichomonas foetus]|uniref:Origin recognition complex subunit 3 winged helix C-terminal domain-containing protein n=1 Tax=Tritrichomonas foetus TaxID=1144522 RepID=A0A1J4J9P2_9EUKA|nr:hypothetical protein TRFO_37984 [Tritrichomonas foetus]|eukprot:OHS95910.1 hypothetical protein TRFO_37984 [Tritrichomonas foetus]
MDCVRVTVQSPGEAPLSNELEPFEYIDKALSDWWNTFFDSSADKLYQNLKSFFAEHDNSPFPVVAHVIPPQDEADSIVFVKMMTSYVDIPFIDKKIHHIQQDKMILFHTSSPPSNVPRVLSIFNCYDSIQQFEVFIDGVLRILFGAGITPDNAFIGTFRSLFFDKYHSFSYLMTILRQSILVQLISPKVNFFNIFECEYEKYIEKFLRISLLSNPNTISSLIKVRVLALDLAKNLLEKYNIDTHLFSGVNNFDDFWKGKAFTDLLIKLGKENQDELKTYLQENTGELKPMFVYEISQLGGNEQNQPTNLKSRRNRQMALLGNKNTGNSATTIIDKFFRKAFNPVPEKFPNLFLLADLATFNPRNGLMEQLSDTETKNDTAIAYQLLKEQEAKTVNAADWMNAFSARVTLKKQKVDKALILCRFQVAVSELEYLGFIDKRTRKPGTFRHIIRV